MWPHPILMQTLHDDRNREVETILTQRQQSDEAAGNDANAFAARPHPGNWIVGRVKRIFGVRRGFVWARA
jgi:hypothetical protein